MASSPGGSTVMSASELRGMRRRAGGRSSGRGKYRMELEGGGVGGGGARGPSQGHVRSATAPSAGRWEQGGERGFFDYFFNPRPGGGTPMRDGRGNVVADLRGALSVQGGVEREGEQPQGVSVHELEGAAAASVAGGGGGAEAGGGLGVGVGGAARVADGSVGAMPGGAGQSMGDMVHARTIERLQREADDADRGRREAEEELRSVRAQLSTAISLLEEYRAEYGPLPAK